MSRNDFEPLFLQQDRLLAVLPEGHYLTKLEHIPINRLSREPFLLLEKERKAEISEIFERSNLLSNVRFTTWDDYAIMSMVESGLALRNKKTASSAVKKFM